MTNNYVSTVLGVLAALEDDVKVLAGRSTPFGLFAGVADFRHS